MDPGGLTSLQWRPHSQEYMGSTNYTWWVKKNKDTTLSGLRGIGEGDEYDQNTLFEIFKELIKM